MRQVFISHAHEDREFTSELVTRLSGAGLRVWMDDSDIRAGREWQSAIDEAVDSCDALIVVLSPHAARSSYVSYEWARALGASVPLVPILIADTELHPRLETIQHLDFREGRPWERLFDALGSIDPRRDDTPPVVRNAMAGLDDPLDENQLAAVKQLAALHHPAASRALRDALGHPSVRVGRMAALALGGDDSDESVRALTRVVEAEDSPCRKWALWALSERPRPRPVQELIRRFIASEESWPRAAVARSLGHVGDPDEIALLVDLLRDSSPSVRGTAVEALSKVGASALPYVIDAATGSSNVELLFAVATVLLRIGDDSAVPLLASLLEVEEAGKLMTIVEVLPEATPRSGSGFPVRARAESALKVIGTSAALAVLEESSS